MYLIMCVTAMNSFYFILSLNTSDAGYEKDIQVGAK
jgi:hypothetical protein